MRRRVWINHWTTVVIDGRKPAEIDRLCRACASKERRKTILMLGVVALAVMAALLLIAWRLGSSR